ncbi:peptidyl-prolyl cis-trans isomerase D [Orussus abietinus]|uniref:peptidyl-prolyl cis-trans isomerase D n=1 Tax=Orussus abietinus TaxID=222816 RepID=UPI000625503A|nr:peptidyl-prolyl cis-trans isomerase D [Orussus abietinus]
MKRSLEEWEDNFERNPIVFLDTAVGQEKVGRVVIELFKNTVPRTAENFRALCTGEKGIGTYGKKLHYKGCTFHKVIPQFMIQSGDIVNFDGTLGESIYGPHFDDENFEIPHSSAGLLSSVNEGRPNTNSSQFIITTVPCPHLDGTNVVFGKVLRGLGVVMELNQVPTMKDTPVEKICITDCGELKWGENWGLGENDGSEDIFTPWPEDWVFGELNNDGMEDIVRKIKDSGNVYFTNKNYIDADRKYKKALRYYNWITKQPNISETMGNDKSLKSVILLNLTAVKLKQNKYREALKLCNEVLCSDDSNSKALFRRGQAYMGLNEYDLGLADLKRANIECPNNKDIMEEIERTKKVMRCYLTVERATCRRMFQ